MNEKITSEMMSRRKALSVLVAALGLAVPTVALTGSDAEAQTVGMTRRQDRRTGRHERVMIGAQVGRSGATPGAQVRRNRRASYDSRPLPT